MSLYDKEYEDYDSPVDDIYPETFYHQLRIDLELHIDKLEIDSIDVPRLHHKYLSMKKRAKKHLEEIEIRHRTLTHNLQLYYEGRAADEEYKKRPLNLTLDKKDIDRFVKAENAYKYSEKIVTLWRLRVEFLTKIVEQIGNRSYLIHNAIEYLKFTKGGD